MKAAPRYQIKPRERRSMPTSREWRTKLARERERATDVARGSDARRLAEERAAVDRAVAQANALLARQIDPAEVDALEKRWSR